MYNNTSGKNKNTGSFQENGIQFDEFLKRALFSWPLYILVLIVSFFLAILYLRYSKPVYSSTTKIYIKDQKKSGSSPIDDIKDLALFGGGSKLVENEMEVIKSPLILQDVIRDNKFNIQYYVKGRLAEYELYENNPIRINTLSDSSKVGDHVIEVNRKNNQNFEVVYYNEHKLKVFLKIILDKPFVLGKDTFSISFFPSVDVSNATSYKIRIDSISPLAYIKADALTTTLVNKQASVFSISYEDAVAKRSADFLNAVCKRYKSFTLEDKNETLVNTINFINTRLNSLGGELNVLERNVEAFKKARGITEIDESAKLILTQAQDADQKLEEANVQLSIYNEVEKYINSSGSSAPFTAISSSMDQTLTSLINRYQEQMQERKRLSLSLQPTNAILQNMDQQIEESRSTIKNYISGYRRNAATAKVGIERKVNKIEGMIAQIPGYEREYISLKRQQSVKEALYVYLLKKKEESEVSFASTISDSKVISPAFIPIKPVEPKKATVLIVFIGFGFLFASAYLLLKTYLNNKVINIKDIDKIIKYPVIAQVLKHDVPATNKFNFKNTRSILNEQILGLRNNLKFLLQNEGNNPVILFTSSISGEGKTFLSAYLGNALTNNSKKVLLMELDLRKPKLSQSLGMSNKQGITNYLIGNKELHEIIVNVPSASNLYLLPSGPIPPNPIELLESDKMKSLFAILKKQFDYIIIDTSPIGLVADANTLAPNVDCILFVTRFNYTPKQKLAEVARNFENVLVKKIGVIFNGIDSESSSGYSYSNYNYGYGENIDHKTLFIPFIKRRLIKKGSIKPLKNYKFRTVFCQS